MSIVLFTVAIVLILSGFPVAFVLAGTALLFTFIGMLTGTIDTSFLHLINSRLYGIMTNSTLLAIPLFIFMGMTLQHSRIAENLLEQISHLFPRLRGSLSFAVVIVGALLAASTGIVGATVVTMGLIALPSMLKNRYDPRIACGTICAAGTLGQIVPPSIVLVLLGDVISSSYQTAQTSLGIFAPRSVSVIDLFAGALFPGILLIGLYLTYLAATAVLRPQLLPALPAKSRRAVDWKILGKTLLAPMLLIIAVLGTILAGAATPTEAAATGAVGAVILSALNRGSSLNRADLQKIVQSSTRITCMVFMILIGASLFSMSFRGFGGDDLVHQALQHLPGGIVAKVAVVMLIMFALGFFLDFIEITLIVVPIIAPTLLMLGIDPIWLGVMIAVNLQTSFLTPPFGFALFYLRGITPRSVTTSQIYAGATPFIALQLMVLVMLALFPGIATWLPNTLFPE